MATTADCLSSANDLLAVHSALLSRVRTAQKYHRHQLATLPSPPQPLIKLALIPSPSSPSPSPPSSPIIQPRKRPHRPDLPLAKRVRVARYDNYVPEEETIRNDYSQRYVDGGEWPQNWVLGADPEHRFEEYPKQQRLLSLKKMSVDTHAIPPTYLQISQISALHPAKFDVILIDPPFSSSFTWNELQDLPIPSLAADPSFVLLWVGSGAGDGLERGREVLARWGFRRCEDIVWVKTNCDSNAGPGTDPPTSSLLTRTKQHCLMGIRGTVRRSTDSWFVHCNVDTDVMLWEGDPDEPTLKPPEMYTLVENFCLGLRRLELFAKGRTLRRGWVSVLADGEERRIPDVDMKDSETENTPRPWDKEKWDANIKELARGGKFVVPMTSDIEALRPKSPVRTGSTNHQNVAAPKQQQQTQQHQQIQQQPHMNMNMNMNMPMNMGMQNPGPSAFAPNHQMMVPQMMAMANGMDPMAMMGWPGGIPGGGMQGINMMAPGFQRGGPPGFNTLPGMQMQGVQGMQGMQGMHGLGIQGMGMGMPGWMGPENFGDGVWNPAMMGMQGPHGMGMNGMNGNMPMDMGQWGPFGFQ